ncbi:hypothetical protein YY92_08270 [Campylobacter fetus]|uniref:hypothetical protein n=1 Tax=Campylobacter fetus TaxID=196 RepID=UPI0011CA2256|nr:hypothetical protein [Campylobacter fetus]EAJ1232617.1 hypothetical protein [Campylobacter fetus]EAK0414704.1 hypothetical protein [Campylobacter fetus]TXF09180.1 hypothetical protein FPD25_03335 [Campylobacter fetus subsp. fetus]
MKKFKTVEMSLIELSNALEKIELKVENERYGFGDIFYNMPFYPHTIFGDYLEEKWGGDVKKYIASEHDGIFEGYKVGSVGSVTDSKGEFVVELEIIDNAALFEDYKPYLLEIKLKVQIPLKLIEQCEKDMGYNPFSQYI